MGTDASSILDKAPGIIEASAKSPLALAALIILVLGFLAFFYFREAKEITRTIIFVVIGIGAFTLLVAILSQEKEQVKATEAPKPPPASSENPVKNQSDPSRKPRVLLGTPVLAHGVATPRGNAVSITAPGSIENARGESAQLVINFTFANGAPVWANPQETVFRTADGCVATGTTVFRVPTDSYDLGNLPVTIPYYAFNMVPTGGYTRIDLLLTASVYLDGVVVARSPVTPFFFYW